MKTAIVIGLLLAVVFISGCTQQADTTTSTTLATGEMTSQELENQAADMIEQEMEDAIEGIDTGDIENLIPE